MLEYSQHLFDVQSVSSLRMEAAVHYKTQKQRHIKRPKIGIRNETDVEHQYFQIVPPAYNAGSRCVWFYLKCTVQWH